MAEEGGTGPAPEELDEEIDDDFEDDDQDADIGIGRAVGQQGLIGPHGGRTLPGQQDEEESVGSDDSKDSWLQARQALKSSSTPASPMAQALADLDAEVGLPAPSASSSAAAAASSGPARSYTPLPGAAAGAGAAKAVSHVPDSDVICVCGTPFKADAKFCGKCGRKRSEAPEAPMDLDAMIASSKAPPPPPGPPGHPPPSPATGVTPKGDLGASRTSLKELKLRASLSELPEVAQADDLPPPPPGGPQSRGSSKTGSKDGTSAAAGARSAGASAGAATAAAADAAPAKEATQDEEGPASPVDKRVAELEAMLKESEAKRTEAETRAVDLEGKLAEAEAAASNPASPSGAGAGAAEDGAAEGGSPAGAAEGVGDAAAAAGTSISKEGSVEGAGVGADGASAAVDKEAHAGDGAEGPGAAGAPGMVEISGAIGDGSPEEAAAEEGPPPMPKEKGPGCIESMRRRIFNGMLSVELRLAAREERKTLRSVEDHLCNVADQARSAVRNERRCTRLKRLCCGRCCGQRIKEDQARVDAAYQEIRFTSDQVVQAVRLSRPQPTALRRAWMGEITWRRAVCISLGWASLIFLVALVAYFLLALAVFSTRPISIDSSTGAIVDSEGVPVAAASTVGLHALWDFPRLSNSELRMVDDVLFFHNRAAHIIRAASISKSVDGEVQIGGVDGSSLRILEDGQAFYKRKGFAEARLVSEEAFRKKHGTPELGWFTSGALSLQIIKPMAGR
mmetsp:Transcript_48526/g.87838  ORF Transcript_48526/g.87838 Transcript_48526/m.87838 type:complete len:737 (-) Transcript_48526:123-2333(-)